MIQLNFSNMRSIFKTGITAILSCYLVPTTSMAQETQNIDKLLLSMSLEELMEVKITTIATGAKQSVTKAPAITTVITAADIEAIGARDLDEVLETVPGLHVARGVVFSPVYTMRGIYSSYNNEALVLLNGTPINTLYTGGRTLIWGGMPVTSISRIEIIRGPGSAVYGADAFAGVINIITKTTEDIKGTEVGLRGGSFESQGAWLLQGNRWHGYDVALALEYQDTNGPSETIDGDAQTQLDKLFGTHASLTPGTINLSQRQLEANLDIAKEYWRWRTHYQGRDNVGTGAGVVALDPKGRFATDRVNTDLTYQNPHVAEHWEVTAQLNYFDTDYETADNFIMFPPGSALCGTYPEGCMANTALSERHTRFHLSGFYSGFNSHLIRLGLGYHYGDLYDVTHITNLGADPKTGQALPPGSAPVDLSGTPYAFMPKTGSRRDWYSFLQDSWTISPAWEITAGLRYDHYSDFGTTTNPRLSLVWQTTAQLTTKVLYGRAFRAPAFQDLYQTNNLVALGNPHLKPEQMEMWELAVDYRPTKKWRLAVNLFTYQARDKIVFLPDPETNTRTAKNAGSQEGRGLEMETQWQVTDNWVMLGNYAFQHAMNNEDDNPGNAPQQQAYLRSDWQFWPQWHLNMQAKWVANRYRVPGDPRPPIDDYTWVDLTLRRQLVKEHWDFAVSVRNLLDADARELSAGPDASGMINTPHDLPLAGRNYWLELRYRF